MSHQSQSGDRGWELGLRGRGRAKGGAEARVTSVLSEVNVLDFDKSCSKSNRVRLKI